MSSIPKKLFWMLGYNNLSIILEQERRHWLLKTDKNKRIQDKLTGDMFQGQIDNIGSDVVIESQKLPYKYTITSSIKFDDDAANDVLSINNSAFPHSAMVNGLMFARIMSTNYAYGNNDINHYKIKFENAEKCIIPFHQKKYMQILGLKHQPFQLLRFLTEIQEHIQSQNHSDLLLT